MGKKNKILLFLIIFSISIIVTYPAFAVSHGLDSYCTMCNEYKDTALWFLQNGRVFSALTLLIFDFLNIPYDSISFISSFLANLFLSFTILKLYLYLDENAKFSKIQTKIIVLISLFLLFYSPLIIEIFVFDESFIMMLGILLITLGSYRIYRGGFKNYLLGFLFIVLAITCYQGIACYLFVILFLLLINDKKLNVKEFSKKIGIGIISYGLAFVLTLILIKVVGLITGEEIAKIGNMDIISNINYILSTLFPNSLRYLFGFIDYRYYYGIILVLFVFACYIIFRTDNKKTNIFFMILGVCFCLVVPFIPNVFMNSSSNYTAARMCMTLGSLPSLVVLFILLRYKLRIREEYFVGMIISLFLLLSIYLIHQNLMINFKRYKEDVKYIKEVNAKISLYENESKIKVKKIYYAYDTDSAYYYSFGHNNGVNIRVMAVDWGFSCAFKVYAGNNYKLLKMKKDDYKKYYANKNYNDIYNSQFKFVDDRLYLLIY
ncbi:MAG: glucosyltransferase domain-containing protein [Bacilli bacterium]|nr:glucosyltransferase domain-containing protein [Bacilli bacterium]